MSVSIKIVILDNKTAKQAFSMLGERGLEEIASRGDRLVISKEIEAEILGYEALEDLRVSNPDDPRVKIIDWVTLQRAEGKVITPTGVITQADRDAYGFNAPHETGDVAIRKALAEPSSYLVD